MKVISKPGTCQRCGSPFTGNPPGHGLCEPCLSQLEAQLTDPSCRSCGGPVCQDCGQRMVLFVPVPWPMAACPNLAAGEGANDGG